MSQEFLTPAAMKRGAPYNWKHASRDRLIYIGKLGHWHQFKKIGDPRAVWCEVTDEDLDMLEETAPCAACGSVHAPRENTLCAE